MSLKNMTLLASATVSTTGGTALAFAEDGVAITNGVHLIVPADADFQTRRSVTAKYKPPILDPKTSSYGKDKKSISLTLPQVLTDGRIVFNVIRIEREVHPTLAAASATELNKLAAQMLTDTDVDGFWATGSLS